MLHCKFLALAAVTAGVMAGVPSDPELQTIFTRIADTQLVTQDVAAFDALLAYNLSFITTNYTFSDINYSQNSAAWWYAEFHIRRTLSAAIGYSSPASAWYQNSTLLQMTIGLMDWWLVHNPLQNGWWYDQVGTPDSVGRLLIVLEAAGVAVADNQTAAALSIIKRAWTMNMCGSPDANCVWLTTNKLYYGLLTDNTTLVAECTSTVWGTVAIHPGASAGIKADNSFWMHGNLNYVGGYGMSYVNGVIHFLAWTRNTTYYLPDPDQLQLFSNFLVLGPFRSMHFGAGHSVFGPPMWDFGVIHRDIARAYGNDWFTQAGQAVIFDAGSVARIGGQLEPQLTSYAALLNGTASPADAALTVGNSVFYISDYVTHTRPGWMASLHMSSSRTLRSECINGESLQGNHLGEGSSFLMQTGYEYANIQPAWDWRLIPGTSANPVSQLSCGDVGGFGVTSFVGAASDGTRGVSAFDFVAPKGAGVVYRKSSAFFTDAVVYLTANLTNTNSSSQPLWSAVEQRILSAPYTPGQPLASTDIYTSSSPTTPLAPGAATLPAGTWWVWEGNTGYLFPDASAGTATYTIGVRAQAVQGNWSSIGAQDGGVDMATFTLYLQHPAPVSAQAFSYIVVPAISLSAFTAQADALLADYAIVANTPAVQAVVQKSANTLAAAVYAGSGATIAAPGKLATTVTSAGAYLLTYATGSSGATATLAASNPAQTKWSLGATVACSFTASANCTASGGFVAASPPATGASAIITCAATC